MSADVIPLWSGEHAPRIRIPGPGEDTFNAEIIILPVIRVDYHGKPIKPRRRST